MASVDKMMFRTPPGAVEVRTVCEFEQRPGLQRIQRQFFVPDDLAVARQRAAHLKKAWPHCKTKLIIGRGRAK